MFQIRAEQDEWMDSPETEVAEFAQALQDIQWVNLHLRGTQVIKDALFSQIENEASTQRVLDIGTGSADIPLALAQHARKVGQPLKITAIDLHPIAVEVAQRFTNNYPEIQVVQADALALPYEDQAFDWAISSMFMHHLGNEQAVRLLQEMARLSRKGFIINDLERHPVAYWGIKLLGHLTGKGRIFLNDAPLSVLRGFQYAELKALCIQSQLPSIQIIRQRPFRWLITWIRNDDHSSP